MDVHQVEWPDMRAGWWHLSPRRSLISSFPSLSLRKLYSPFTMHRLLRSLIIFSIMCIRRWVSVLAPSHWQAGVILRSSNRVGRHPASNLLRACDRSLCVIQDKRFHLHASSFQLKHPAIGIPSDSTSSRLITQSCSFSQYRLCSPSKRAGCAEKIFAFCANYDKWFC